MDNKEFFKKMKKMNIEKDYIYWIDNDSESVAFMKLSKLDNIRMGERDIIFGGNYKIYDWENGCLEYSWGSKGYLPDIHLGVSDKDINFDIIAEKDILKLMTLIELEREE